MHLIFWIIGCLFMLAAYASPLQTLKIQTQAEKDITQLYHKLPASKQNIIERIDWFSQQFVGVPYLLGALGEGPDAKFDQFPIYRTDAFDCETLVDTVLALAIAKDTKEFIQWIQKIRYKNGKKSYISRNHFTELDWNYNNQALGLIEDITQSIGQNNTAFAKTIIDKPGWYLKLPLTTIRLQNSDEKIIKKRHQILVDKHKLFKSEAVITPYLPFTLLFDKNKQPNMKIFKQIPQGAIVEIVRPNWPLKEKMGTNLNISHMGFAIWKNTILYYREASSDDKVIDIPLVDYLLKYIDSPTVKGINIQAILGNHSSS